jgi:pimeloyl-ACP methyl ester carboxylesterase
LSYFTAPDGTRIAFADEGEGRPLLLLHGLMAHAGFFEPQRALADRFRVIRLDLRGHGNTRSDGPAPTVELLAEDVAALVRLLDLEGVLAVGWSLGAAVLWRALAGPEGRRFAGAVVVDMTPRVLNDGAWQLGLSRETCAARSAAIAGDFPAFAAAAGQAIFASPSDRALWASEEFARADASAVGALWSSLVDQDFRGSLGRIRQPTLVVHGALSHLYGEGTADHLVDALPDATALRFERSGHAPHLEEPERFNAALADFAALLPPVQPQPATA